MKNVDEDTGAQLETTLTTTIEKTTTIENWVAVTNQWPPFTASGYTVVADPTLVSSIKSHPLIPQVSPSIDTIASASLAEIGPAASTPSNYIFNSQSNSNIAIYYGQSPLTSSSSLSTQCTYPAIDIVIVAFVTSQTDFSGTSRYPTVNFGVACNFDQTPLMASQARGLLYCPDLAREIKICQGVGKKVLLSLGGYTGTIAFGSEEEAIEFAGLLWGLFGPWEGNELKVDEGLRPFGRIVLDGFDIDSENNQPQYYETLAKTLRYLFSTATDKTYYLSSAPQCPFPDASNPTSMLLLCDFVFVQFYNNPSCEVGSSGHDASIKQWASVLKGEGKDRSLKWFLGAPAWSAAGPTAYANFGSAEAMKAVARHVASERFENFGRVMFWAGPEGLANMGGGKSIIAWAKEGLDI
ncbi:hypothetical protein EYC80_008409 [Monilinia laxa]|uniref:chitinase n=1 Tax=Monilinia laxa TaxID=61186 RepID=A0A5N6JSS9_MONLA|nr:hypothetical protein EYC80_008409 [Monilinia laxa]